MEGWISLYRKIQEHWLWTKKRKFSQFEAWVYILFKANHKETKIMVNEELITISKGSFITSEVKLSKDWCWNRSTVRNFLLTLEKDKMITKNATSKYTSISVENWEFYQNGQHQNQQQNNINATSKQHQNNTDNNVNNINNENKKKEQEEKIHFAEFVTMTNAEYERLVSTHGKDFADQCITVLDNYKGSSGKKYKNDYRAILSWVEGKVKEDNKKNKNNPKISFNNFEQRSYDDFNKLYANKQK